MIIRLQPHASKFIWKSLHTENLGVSNYTTLFLIKIIPIDTQGRTLMRKRHRLSPRELKYDKLCPATTFISKNNKINHGNYPLPFLQQLHRLTSRHTRVTVLSPKSLISLTIHICKMSQCLMFWNLPRLGRHHGKQRCGLCRNGTATKQAAAWCTSVVGGNHREPVTREPSRTWGTPCSGLAEAADSTDCRRLDPGRRHRSGRVLLDSSSSETRDCSLIPGCRRWVDCPL